MLLHYPAAGMRRSTDGAAVTVGLQGYYRSATSYTVGYSYVLTLELSNFFELRRGLAFVYGYSVRCVSVF